MNARLHNHDRVNNAIQRALKKYYPHLQIQLVPTTVKQGLDSKNRRMTQVVSCQQAERNHLNNTLVKIFQESPASLLEDIFLSHCL
jgi:hypothetical protein